MKTLLAILIATVVTAAPASAGYCRPRPVCAPYVVNTCEIDRCVAKRTGYDNCGNCYTYRIVTVTYRDHYSDGTCRTYRRSFRA